MSEGGLLSDLEIEAVGYDFISQYKAELEHFLEAQLAHTLKEVAEFIDDNGYTTMVDGEQGVVFTGAEMNRMRNGIMPGENDG